MVMRAHMVFALYNYANEPIEAGTSLLHSKAAVWTVDDVAHLIE